MIPERLRKAHAWARWYGRTGVWPVALVEEEAEDGSEAVEGRGGEEAGHEEAPGVGDGVAD